MKKIIEASEIPANEKVYLKKDLFGWRVVEPPKKFLDYIYGSKRNAFKLLFILLLVGLFYFGINQLLGNYKEIADNPCGFCNDCHEQTRKVINRMNYEERFGDVNFTFMEGSFK